MMAWNAKDNEALQGLRVLVVEDEPLIAWALVTSLRTLGCTVVGPAATVPDALSLAEDTPLDGAILDVNVAGEKVFAVADALTARDVPFAFTTGYGVAGLRDRDRGQPVLQKPYRLNSLVEIARKWQRP